MSVLEKYKTKIIFIELAIIILLGLGFGFYLRFRKDIPIEPTPPVIPGDSTNVSKPSLDSDSTIKNIDAMIKYLKEKKDAGS